MQIIKLFNSFKHDERGVTALKHAILAGVDDVAVAALGVTTSTLDKNTFATISTQVDSAVNH